MICVNPKTNKAFANSLKDKKKVVIICFKDVIDEIAFIGLKTLSDLKALNYTEVLMKYYKEPATITNASITFQMSLKYAPEFKISPFPIIFINASM